MTQRMSTGRRWFLWILVWIGIALMLLSVVGIVDFMIDGEMDGTNERDALYGSVLFLVVGIAMTVPAIISIRRDACRAPKSQRAELERATVRVAALHRNPITIATLINETQMSADTARDVLENLCEQGIAVRKPHEDGVMRYSFPGVEDE